MAQNKDNPEAYRQNWAYGTEQRQSRDIQELGTMHRTKTIQRHRGRIGHKAQNKDRQINKKAQHKKGKQMSTKSGVKPSVRGG